MISLKQLSYALAVEKTLHFKKAAEKCHVSQSALSTALSKLEQQLGFQIFERDNKKVLITPSGKAVLARARDIILQIEDLQSLGDSSGEPLCFPMDIGIIPTVAPYLLPQILPVINTQFPKLKLNIIEEQSHALVDMVRSGQIDTAILALPFSCDGLLTLEFWQEDFFWITQSANKDANRQEITSHELAQTNLMLLKEGHCLKDHILDVCQLPQNAAHSFSATSLNTLTQMVAGGLGSTLIPALALSQLVTGNQKLTAIHLNEPSPHRRLAFIMRPNYSRLSSIEKLIEVCRLSLEK